MNKNFIRMTASLAVILALLVVMLGAYTRLTDAGLGCPDWPGCYGQMLLPGTQAALQKAQMQYPHIPIETRKAWTEMLHRYAAGTLALFIFFIALSALRSRAQSDVLPWRIPAVLVLLVIFQAALGMWTVTLKLLPVVVMGHLLGGMLIVACLSRFRLQISSIKGHEAKQWRPWLRFAVLIVLIQIALGGWVSSNYAGISCIGFPQCTGIWWPELHFTKGFNLLSPVGANYQGGVLDNEVRMSIQFIHRLGAIITASYLIVLALFLRFKSEARYLRLAALIMLGLIVIQFTLGILNVLYLLPISIAVAHNGVAALLLALVFSMLQLTHRGMTHAH